MTHQYTKLVEIQQKSIYQKCYKILQKCVNFAIHECTKIDVNTAHVSTSMYGQNMPPPPPPPPPGFNPVTFL